MRLDQKRFDHEIADLSHGIQNAYEIRFDEIAFDHEIGFHEIHSGERAAQKCVFLIHCKGVTISVVYQLKQFPQLFCKTTSAKAPKHDT